MSRMADELERLDADPPPAERSPRLSFRSRLTISLFSAAVLPMAGFAIVVLLIGISLGGAVADPNVARILLFVVAIVVTLAVVVSYALAEELTRPLRSIAESVDRVSEGDLSTPIQVAGGDELAALADSHNRLAADLRRRDRELARILASIGEVSLVDDVDALVERTASEAMCCARAARTLVCLPAD
jgi:methyl-accepting chemotaxis protein